MTPPHPRGEDHPRARLTQRQVEKGRRLRAKGTSVADSMMTLRVPDSCSVAFWKAVSGASWRWMDDPPPVPRLPREIRAARLTRMWLGGFTTYEAAEYEGVSQGTAWRAVARHVDPGHPRRRRRP